MKRWKSNRSEQDTAAVGSGLQSRDDKLRARSLRLLSLPCGEKPLGITEKWLAYVNKVQQLMALPLVLPICILSHNGSDPKSVSEYVKD